MGFAGIKPGIVGLVAVSLLERCKVLRSDGPRHALYHPRGPMLTGPPSAVILDGQTLQRSCESSPRVGYDGYKQCKGSKVPEAHLRRCLANDSFAAIVLKNSILGRAPKIPGFRGHQISR
jgi:hypothetical protein